MLWPTLLNGALALAVTASALAVVEVRHQARGAFGELRGLEVERNRLQSEWRQLVLEERSRVSMGEIEGAALKREMQRPDPQSVVLVPLAPAPAGRR